MGARPLSDQRVNTHALRRMEWKTARWSFLVGARMDKHSLLDKPVFSPRANVRFNPTDNINLRASYSFGFRAPPQLFRRRPCTLTTLGGTVSMIQLAGPGKKPRNPSLCRYVSQLGRLAGQSASRGFLYQYFG